MPVHLQIIKCNTCKKFLHAKCAGISPKLFLNLKSSYSDWTCLKCLSLSLPFGGLDNNDLYFELNNIPVPKSDNINSMPSFTIQSLLDQMMGQNFENDEFLSDIITSKYFTPLKLLESKLPNKFSISRINIA